MRIAIIGARGQLGTALQACLKDELVPLGHADIEIADPARVEAVLSAARANVVINAAAYNFVDRAEDEPDAAYAVNALGPRHLARWCRQASVPLVHVSTDYVFGGASPRRVPHTEAETPLPECQYAAGKLAGEEFVRAECPRHMIVRTCGLYGPAQSTGKGNFVKTVRRLAAVKSELTIVDDQHCTPSFAADVARAIAELIEIGEYGLFHATNSGATTWYEFACEVVRLAGLSATVRPISSSEYPQKAKRPAYSVLDCGKLASRVGRRLPDWQDALARHMAHPESPA